LPADDPEQIASASIDMSPAFIKGVATHSPAARVTFDKFHVIAHASVALDKMRRLEQKTDPDLKGLRWALLKARNQLHIEQRRDLDVLVARFPASVLRALGCIASSCATSSIASKSMSSLPFWANGVPM
jgi:transposase